MCIKFNFAPLVEDVILNKRYIKFNSIFHITDASDLQSRLRMESIFNRDHRLKKFERLIKFVNVPCGHCSECLNTRAKGIVFRILKECENHSSNYFITLTYDDFNLPAPVNLPDGRLVHSLVQEEISKFIKKLRIYLKRHNKKSDIRFYGVGEYGSLSFRPHYHIIIFGLELDDLKFYKFNEFKQPLYNSEFLSSIWNKGFVVVGSVDSASAAYVARYTEKKQFMTKEEKEKFISLGLVPEFSRQSLKPGIGFNYLDECVQNIKNGVFTTSIKGSSYSFPKYYMDKVKKILEYDPILDYYSNYSNLLLSDKLSGFILSYGLDYLKVLNNLDIQKKLNKSKRKKI